MAKLNNTIMESDNLDIFDIYSDEFKFLDFPNTFLSNDYEDNELNKSANTQLEENFKELIKKTSSIQSNGHLTNGNLLNGHKTNYLDELNDLKELKKIENKKSYEQSLDRLSKLNLGKNGYTNRLSTIFSPNHSKFNQQQFNNEFKSNNLTNKLIDDLKFDANATFDLRNYGNCDDSENEKTFIINNKLLDFTDDDNQQADDTFTVAKDYDQIQEIARKQEEVLKKRESFLPTNFNTSNNQQINNATITKTKKFNKLDNTITLKHFLNESLNDSIKSPNLDGTFNLGNPLDNYNSPLPNNKSPLNNGTIKKEKLQMPNQNNNILINKTNVKRVLNNNRKLETKTNPLNTSFIVQQSNLNDNLDQYKSSNLIQKKLSTYLDTNNGAISGNQFSTITKNKINKNLKRTNTFKVREQAYASEENLTYTSRNGNPLNQSFVKSGPLTTNYQSIDDMKNYETIKLGQRKINSSKSNGNINSLNGTFNRDTQTTKNLKDLFNNTESQENLSNGINYKSNIARLPFASRLKAPSRVSIIKSEEF